LSIDWTIEEIFKNENISEKIENENMFCSMGPTCVYSYLKTTAF